MCYKSISAVMAAAAGHVMLSPKIPASNFQILPFWFCFHMSSAALKMPADRGWSIWYSEDELC